MNQKLATLPVVLVYFQTTGANPRQRHLIELAWARIHAAPVVHLVRLPRGNTVPAPIARLTGIRDQDLRTRGLSRPSLWARFRADVYGEANPAAPPIWTVAHFARFEEGFLEELHTAFEGSAPFPLRFLCTHQIARRLLPDLPRRGLHALAGYFGTPLTERKRARDHLEATMVVWRGLVRLLAETENVTTLDDLLGFLKRRPPARGTRYRYPLPRERRLALSERPGVYRFLSGSGDVLYVGKATSLRHRVNSYYRKRRAADRLLELVSQARDVSVTETGSALEAALLETDEIKRLDPPYNRALRDRGRTLHYLSPNLASVTPNAAPDHPLGPVPMADLGYQLLALSRALRERCGDLESLRADLGLEGVPFDLVDLRPAIEDLRERVLKAGGERALSVDGLLARGRRLWRERLAETMQDVDDVDIGREGQAAGEEKGAEDADDREETGDREEVGATGGRRILPLDMAELTDLLDWIPAHAAHLLRRGRWLIHLGHGTLWWAHPDGPGAGGRVVVWNHGQPIHLAHTPARAGIPCVRPDRPGTPEGLDARHVASAQPAGLRDYGTYERLRVFGTELRRLVQQDRPVRLWIRRDRPLTERHLRRILPWV